MLTATSLESLPDPDAGECFVLVVDDDQACLDEYGEMIAAMGYPCLRAVDSLEALRLIASNPRIGIVVTDIQMPAMDGITLLEEVSARIMAKRPMAAIVITGAPSLEAAVLAMRTNAMDFLSKPVSRADLSASLRRASMRIAIQAGQMRLQALTDLVKLPKQSETPTDVGDAPAAGGPTDEQMLAFVRSIVRSRQARYEYIDDKLLSDPGWDMLLDLTSAALEGTPVPASSACAASQVPLTTALRQLRQMEQSGLIRRWQDPHDKRRTLVELEPATITSMKDYLRAIWARRAGAVI
jgi:FixJ family two-component response regulator